MGGKEGGNIIFAYVRMYAVAINVEIFGWSVRKKPSMRVCNHAVLFVKLVHK